MLKVLDLFSGIGGFTLGLERTGGFQTVAFCEIEEFPRRVLAKHWPGVPIHRDVRALKGSDVEAVDVICGGFPCQDISVAGKGEGLAGERSGLWREYARLVGELRPRYVLVENVAALLGRGLGVVLGDLAALGYDAEWHCIPASAVGAPYLRDRIWIIAYSNREDDGRKSDGRSVRDCAGKSQDQAEGPNGKRHRGRSSDGREAPMAANPNGDGLQIGEYVSRVGEQETACLDARRSSIGVPSSANTSDAECRQQPLGAHTRRMGRFLESIPWDGDWPITAQPVLGRGVDGLPAELERDRKLRLVGLGNAVVPQIPEAIGRAVLASEALRSPSDSVERAEASEPPKP